MGVAPMHVKMQLNKLSASFFGNSPSKDSDPAYLWVVFFKIDGDSASVNSSLQLQGTATVVPMPGNHGDLILNEGQIKQSNQSNSLQIPGGPLLNKSQCLLHRRSC
jgi:hypothetical protein